MAIRGETIWITGASSGIGAALAVELASQNNRIIISARSSERLNAIAAKHANIETLIFDITDRHSLDTVRDALHARVHHFDRVIFNAGTCEYLDIDAPDWSLPERVMTTNYFGLVNSLAVSFDLLKRAAHPHLIGIGSQATRAPFPRAEAYGASKAAIGYFLESLRLDVAHLNIDVTHILPGFVDTPLTRKNDFPMPFIVTAENAAQRILAAIEARPFEYAFPRRLSASLWLARHCPKWWLRTMQKNSTRNTTAPTQSND
ncbi:MAG: SDR family NAD(P)-dependent oxidoreductase [Spongiibacteraceae bacterium]